MPASDARVSTHDAHTWRETALWSGTSGALAIAAWPPLGLWPCALLFVLPMAWMALRAASTRRALLAAGVSFLLVGLWRERWIMNVSVPGYPLLALYAALYPVLFAWLLRRTAHGRRTAAWPLTLLLPVLWIGTEFVRARLLLDGYAWYLVAQPLVEAPILVQTADLGGASLVGFLALLPTGWLLDVMRSRRGGAPAWCVRRGSAVMVVLCGAIVYGAGPSASPSARINVLAIQTNLPQDNKVEWTFEAQQEDFARFFRETIIAWEEAGGSEGGVDLIAWPETMVPGFGMEAGTLRYLVENGYSPSDEYVEALRALADATGLPLLVGSPAFVDYRHEGDEWRWDSHYNSAYLVHGEPPFQRYDKVLLTPFGESVPYTSAWPALEQFVAKLGAAGMRFNLDPAETLRVLELPDGHVVGTPICFEDTAARVCRRQIYDGGVKRGHALINLSNDGWFGRHDGVREVHAQIARLRCVENRVPMVRVANTGVSVSIDASGNLLGAIGEGRYGTGRRPGWLLASLPLDDRSTVYGRVGEAWGWMMLIATLLIAVATRKKEADA